MSLVSTPEISERQFHFGGGSATAASTSTIEHRGSGDLSVRSPQALLVTADRTAPFQKWVGQFDGKKGSARRLSLRIEAWLTLLHGVVEGEGACEWPPPAIAHNFSITGMRSIWDVAFEIWFAPCEMAHTPIIATGSLSLDERSMEGVWSLACFTGCDCGGGSGTFRLFRHDYQVNTSL